MVFDKCWVCGKEAVAQERDFWQVLDDDDEFDKWLEAEETEQKFNASFMRCFCDECFTKFLAQRIEIYKEYKKLKTKVMYERALRIMERSNSVFMSDIKDYAEEVLREALESQGYASSYEMVAAIMLKDEGVEYQKQVQIAKHRVDFVLPDIKTVLEIDGYMHAYAKKKDEQRDIDILGEKGLDWVIIRIKTHYLDKNPTMLYTAVEELRKKKLKEQVEKQKVLFDYFRDKAKKTN